MRVFLKYTEIAGATYIREHHLWVDDPADFVAARRGECDKDDVPIFRRVDQVTQADYDNERFSNARK